MKITEEKLKKLMFAIMLTAVLVTGCAKAETAQPEPVNVSRFQTVEDLWNWLIVADKETGVMYAVSRGTYNQGTFTLLVDADGKPLIWEGDMDE